MYRLTQPMSPHAAAEIDGIEINIEKIISAYQKIQAVQRTGLIIEGAGGLMVPLNKQHLVINLIQMLNIPMILVSQNYLGSINHTLLSIEALKTRNINIKGIVFNGKVNQSGEQYILDYTGVPCVLRVDEEKEINKDVVLKYCRELIL